jgi:hypothetical protein
MRRRERGRRRISVVGGWTVGGALIPVTATKKKNRPTFGDSLNERWGVGGAMWMLFPLAGNGEGGSGARG